MTPWPLAVDNDGNVYVTGGSYGGTTGFDIATVKYDTDGNRLWAALYNGPGNAEDGAFAVTVDSSGYVYVTGVSTGSGSGYDYATIKIWARRKPTLGRVLQRTGQWRSPLP